MKMPVATTSWIALATSLALAAVSAPALAQTGSSPSSTTAPQVIDQDASAQKTELRQPASTTNPPTIGTGDIIVTAQRRSESLMRVPIAISAFSEETLRSAGIVDTPSLQTVTPGVVFGSAAAYQQFYIRGVGNDSTTPGVESSVAVYVDGIYRTQLISGLENFVDLERVEVLKGPQGTLYGRNALGGAINIVTKQPSMDRFTGTISSTLGNYGRREISGYVSGPLVDHVAFSVGGTYVRTSGYGINLFNNTRVDADNFYSIFAKLKIELGDRTTVLLAADRFDRDDTRNVSFGQGSATPLAATLPQASVLAGAIPALAAVADRPVQFTDQPWRYYNNSLPYDHLIDQGASLKITHDLSFAEITSLTSYRSLKWHALVDIDGTNRPIFAFAADPQVGRTFTQDLQLVSNGSGVSPFRWVVGASYLKDHSGYQNFEEFIPILGPLGGGPGEVAIDGREGTEAIAAFAEGTYKLAPKLEITAGGRFTTEKKTLERADTVLPTLGVTIANPLVPASKRWNAFTPHVSLNYQIDPSTLLYVSFSKGFKSGSYNTTQTTPAPCKSDPTRMCVDPVNPEKINAVQGGIKARVAGGRIDVEAAGFYYDYKDLQTQVVGGAGVTVLQNAASATLYGVDGSVRARLIDHLSMQAGATILSAKYDTFTGVAFVPDPVNGGNTVVSRNFNGITMVRAPKLTANTAVSYEVPLVNGSAINLSANGYYSASYKFDAAGYARQGAYTLVNLRVEYAMKDGLSIAAWVRNLTNQAYLTTVQINAIGQATQWNEPRMYGGTVQFKF